MKILKQNQFLARASFLQKPFSNTKNVKKLLTEVFGVEFGNWWY